MPWGRIDISTFNWFVAEITAEAWDKYDLVAQRKGGTQVFNFLRQMAECQWAYIGNYCFGWMLVQNRVIICSCGTFMYDFITAISILLFLRWTEIFHYHSTSKVATVIHVFGICIVQFLIKMTCNQEICRFIYNILNISLKITHYSLYQLHS